MPVSEFAPGLILFGSDGGGEAYAFDVREAVPIIVEVPFIGMGGDEAKRCGASFLSTSPIPACASRPKERPTTRESLLLSA